MCAQVVTILGGGGLRWKLGQSLHELAEAWVDLAELGVPVYGAVGFTYGNYLYIVGGVDRRGKVTSVIQRVNLVTLERDYPQYLVEPRAHFGYGFINNKLYILGGVGSDLVPKSDIYEYNPPANQVTKKSATLPKGVAYCASTTLGNKIYVIGGIDHGGNILKDVYEYDPSTDRVAQKASMNVARENLSCADLEGKIYCFGGDDGSSALQVVERYDPSTDTWSVLDIKLPVGLTGLRASKILINNKNYILLVGG